MSNSTPVPNRLFEGCRAKIARAEFHFKQFESHIERFKKDLYGLVATKDDSQTGERVVYAVYPHHLFLGFSIVVGDVIHQARSALDHLIYAMPRSARAKPKERISGFPIFWDADKYKINGKPMIDGLSPAAIAIIDGLQPIKPDYASDPLYVLQDLWNRDKHRLLSMTRIRLNAFKEGYRDAARTFYLESPIFNLTVAATEDGTEIGRFHPPLTLTPEVEVIQHAEILGPLFEDAGPATGQDPLKLLPLLIERVESITNDLIATIR
jgi:hypothetical protein